MFQIFKETDGSKENLNANSNSNRNETKSKLTKQIITPSHLPRLFKPNSFKKLTEMDLNSNEISQSKQENIQQIDDENLYEKVYLSKNNHSFDQLKESINNFRKNSQLHLN